MGAGRKGLVFAALLGALLLGPTPGPSASLAASPAPVSDLTGQGWKGKAMCMGCGISIVAAGGMTWGGILLLSYFHADAVIACGYICYGAFTT